MQMIPCQPALPVRWPCLHQVLLPAAAARLLPRPLLLPLNSPSPAAPPGDPTLEPQSVQHKKHQQQYHFSCLLKVSQLMPATLLLGVNDCQQQHVPEHLQ
jgi:hypothetical protein